MAFSSSPMPSARDHAILRISLRIHINVTMHTPWYLAAAPRRKLGVHAVNYHGSGDSAAHLGQSATDVPAGTWAVSVSIPERCPCRSRPQRAQFDIGRVRLAEIRQLALSGMMMLFCTSIVGSGGASNLGVGSGVVARGGILPLMASILSGLPPPPPAMLGALGALQSFMSIGVTCSFGLFTASRICLPIKMSKPAK